MRISRSLIFIIVAVLAVGGVAFWYLGGSHRKVPPPPSVESVLPKQFLIALQQQKSGQTFEAKAKTTPGADTTAANASATPAKATLPPLTTPLSFTANGRGQMHISGQNTDGKPASVSMRAGDIYENDQNKIVLLEDCVRDIPPRGMLQADIKVAYITSAAASGNDSYKKSTATVQSLDTLINQLKLHPELSHEAVQTAVLMLAENPPLDAFAKFPRLHASQAAPETNPDFKVDVFDIIAALQLLNDTGITDRTAASDPQLKIEAMIDQKTHDAAMRFYNITPEAEWAFWKNQLLEGDPSLRHYALYGIAESYPDVALIMLPKWAREKRLPAIYRLSAVRAMAMTHRAEAIPILQKLEQEFTPDTDLYRSADHATKYLTTQLNQPS